MRQRFFSRIGRFDSADSRQFAATGILCLVVYLPVLFPGNSSVLFGDVPACLHRDAARLPAATETACCSQCCGEGEDDTAAVAEGAAQDGAAGGCSCPFCPDDGPCRLCSFCLLCVAAPMTTLEFSPLADGRVVPFTPTRPDAPTFGLLHVPRA